MAERYRILGAENSPYSVKVRSFFRYRGAPHDWVLRSQAQEEFQRLARLPLIPLVVTPDGEGVQDSTPIIERFDRELPGPSIHPDDPASAFLSALIEEFADEWGNKWMFHYRWARDADQRAASRRLVDDMLPDAPPEQVEEAAAGIRERMVPRLWFVGSSDLTAARIETSFEDAVALLERHLEPRPYLFGDRPAFADFGLGAQIYECGLDPTPAAILDAAPRVRAWSERMLAPEAHGDFEPLADLRATLEPLLERQVGALFLPWSDANARAVAAGDDEFEIDLAGRRWVQKPQKYHARSLAALRRRWAELDPAVRADLDGLLAATGCLRWLESPPS